MKSKYRNIKTVVDGITFDSKKEAKRYQELKLMERAGEILHLKTQQKIGLRVNRRLICKYIADFIYVKNTKENEKKLLDKLNLQAHYPEFIAYGDILVVPDIQTIEDVKSEITRKNPVYRIKKKLMKAIYGIDILET